MDTLCFNLYKTTHMTHTNPSEDKHVYCIPLDALLNGNNLSSGECHSLLIHFETSNLQKTSHYE